MSDVIRDAEGRCLIKCTCGRNMIWLRDSAAICPWCAERGMADMSRRIFRLEADLRAAQAENGRLRGALERAATALKDAGYGMDNAASLHQVKTHGVPHAINAEQEARAALSTPAPASSEYWRGLERAAEIAKTHADELKQMGEINRWDTATEIEDAIRAEAGKEQKPDA